MVKAWNQILEEELKEQNEHTSLAVPSTPRQKAPAGLSDADRDAWEQRETLRYMLSANRTALCFSGGGVRSATFGLGVLQGLAAVDFGGTALTEFDFLSTVSGGGYLGSWFSAWATREDSPPAPVRAGGVTVPVAAPCVVAAPVPAKGPEVVTKKLAEGCEDAISREVGPLKFLRQYCAFLDPQLGALSADTWTLVSTVLRNLFLNWFMLIPLIMTVLLVPKMFQALTRPQGFAPSNWDMSLVLIAGGILAALATAFIFYELPRFHGTGGVNEAGFILLGLAPLVCAAILLSLHWSWLIRGHWNYSVLQFGLFAAFVHGVGALLAAILRTAYRKGIRNWGWIWTALVIAPFGGGLAGVFAYIVSTNLEDGFTATWYATFGVPLVLVTFSLVAMLSVGVFSMQLDDGDREWWARAGGWLLMFTCIWIVASACVLYGPGWLEGGYEKAITAIGALGFGGLASLLGFSQSTASGRGEKGSPANKPSWISAIATKLAAPLFLFFLMAGMAWVNAWLTGWIGRHFTQLTDFGASLGLFVAAAMLTVLASIVIDVNRFSLHAMYRERLVRTYLGASHPNRTNSSNPFTDFDDKDNILMHKLSKNRPMHIVNIALNLVAGKNLAWQQRKAESFTVSRLHAGSIFHAYQDTKGYGGADGLSLGTAMAISGAAASPNMGYHSSPILSVIMTLFNARLGWWLPNPGNEGRNIWKKNGPRFALLPIVNEALGRTNDTSWWVYLSDGGHFENLGVYEMLVRRCTTIVVVDGGCDPDYQFEDLGNLVRKARIDLDVSIRFEKPLPMLGKKDPQNRYFTVGKIRYPEDDPSKEPSGKLVYIKACLNGSEPTDVANYFAMHPEFPQEGTEELWFNEAQFESYRRLGYHVVESLLKRHPRGTGSPIERLVQAAEW